MVIRATGLLASSGEKNFFTRWVSVQKRNRIVNALAVAESVFTVTATLVRSPPANRVKKRPSIIKNGAPGGCPTSILKAVAMNSPQSQKLAVGSIVNRYTIREIRKTPHPSMRL
jgi:hypothetical protein